MKYSYVCDFIWGLCVLISWAGWGTILRQILGISDKRTADWGLRAGWGAATTIAIGGVLNVCRISSTPVVIILVVFGLVTELLGVSQRSWRWWKTDLLVHRSAEIPQELRRQLIRRLLVRIGFIGPCVLALAFVYAGSVHQSYYFNAYDDYIAYLVFPVRMLETGTLIEPFSQRRLGTFGGHAFMNAMVFSGSSLDMAWALEMGLCPILIAGLIYGYLRPRSAREFFFAAVLILLSIAAFNPHLNTMSSLTSVVLFVTLFRTIAAEDGKDLRRSKISWATVIIVAAVSTLRVTCLVAAFPILVLSRLFPSGHRSLPGRVRDVLVDCAKAALFLIPWSVLLFISSRSFLYPLMKGNERHPEMQMANNTEIMRWIWQYLSYRPITLILFSTVVPLILPPFRKFRDQRSVMLFTVAVLGATTYMVTRWSPTFNTMIDLYRWTFPLLFSITIAVTSAKIASSYFRGRLVANVIAAGLLLADFYCLANIPFLWELTISGMKVPAPSVILFGSVKNDYRDLQQAIPPGAPFVAILNYSLLLDYKRNEIYNADMLLPYGPYPGAPFFKGPDALKQYFKSLHIYFVAAVDFNEDRMSWYSRPNDVYRVLYSNSAFHVWKPYFLDYMNNIDALERQEQVVFRRNGIRVFWLR